MISKPRWGKDQVEKVCLLEEGLQLEMAVTTMATTGKNRRVKDRAMENLIPNWNLEERNVITVIRRAISKGIARSCWGMRKEEVTQKMERLLLPRESSKMVIFLLFAQMWVRDKTVRNGSWIPDTLITCVQTEIGSRISRKPMGVKSSWGIILLAKLRA